MFLRHFHFDKDIPAKVDFFMIKNLFSILYKFTYNKKGRIAHRSGLNNENIKYEI